MALNSVVVIKTDSASWTFSLYSFANRTQSTAIGIAASNVEIWCRRGDRFSCFPMKNVNSGIRKRVVIVIIIVGTRYFLDIFDGDRRRPTVNMMRKVLAPATI